MSQYNELPEGVQREEMEADIVIVGGGSAGLSAALHLCNMIEKHNAQVSSGAVQGTPMENPMIVVLEKGSEIGAHSLSGAVMNPSALEELVPDYKAQGCPIESPVVEDAVYYLGEKNAFKLPIVPPPFHNEGNYIISVSKLNRWLSGLCEAKGVNVFPGFAAVEALYDGDRIVGIRTGDKGRDKNGKPKANFEPGLIIKSKAVVFAEGPRGSLFKQVSRKLNLRKDSQDETFEEGVKEVIQMPPGTVKPGQVIHTMGFPLGSNVGGTFIYTIPGDKIIVGLVAYLSSEDPLLDPHRDLQRLKTHPWMRKMLEGGQVIAYGGKTLPAGGWYARPQLHGEGWMVCGDSASFVDVQKLKGIHHSMKSGMGTADTLFKALQTNDFSAKTLKAYTEYIEKSSVKKELYRVRNFHQALSQGMLEGMPQIAIQEITGGRGIVDPMPSHKDALTTAPVLEVWGPAGENDPDVQLPTPDGKLFFDKLSSVYLTGTMHDEDSPNHLLVDNTDLCRSVCEPQFKSPCAIFCPAKVYEMLPSTKHEGQKDLHINYTNCIHCKTCDIKCPFENIEWTVPEGGGGPKYTET